MVGGIVTRARATTSSGDAFLNTFYRVNFARLPLRQLYHYAGTLGQFLVMAGKWLFGLHPGYGYMMYGLPEAEGYHQVAPSARLERAIRDVIAENPDEDLRLVCCFELPCLNP